MKTIKEEAEKPANLVLLARGEQWLYSWDNDKIHKGADLVKVGFKEKDRFYLPELSSDMHKVVEHVHGWLQREMQRWLMTQEKRTLTIANCQQQLEHLFYNVLKKESIQKDVLSLADTYEAVVLAGGHYVAKRHR